ncbi:hypothetical protein DMB42_20080 [Nonomuraea sp. WAC 01424]|nr:hypothetical protein DMB42_20080 [Nonomuraea sp. WAC 01424]
MLFGALLAPAILAGGLLAGEMRGFEAVGAPVGMEGRRAVWLAFEPVLLPAPAHPDRRYEGVVPARVRTVSNTSEASEVRPEVPEPEPDPVPVAEDELYTPAQPPPPSAGCAGEWEDTWLWDLCREREEVVRETGDGWLPRL